MKKTLLTILMVALLACACLFFVGCNNTQSNDRDKDILAIYNLYVANAEDNGQTPLSYEEWLESIKGEKGDKGEDGKTPTIEISEDGYWVINGEKTEYKAIGKDGVNGENGANGTNGIDGKTPTIEISEDGYWVINGEKTEYKAIGKDGANGTNGIDGKTPTIEISEDGYWVINGEKTEYKAIGKDGKDGVGVESVRINEKGHLMIKYTNSQIEVDLGKVIETETYSKGLEFELNEQETGYVLTGVGVCNDRKVIIPSEYNGKPVVAIGDSALAYDAVIKVVEIPNSVTSIGVGAFV